MYDESTIDNYQVGTYNDAMKTANVSTNSDRRQHLRSWAEATEVEIKEIAAAIAPLQQRLQAARERLDLIQRLMQLGDGGVTPVPGQGLSPRQSTDSGARGNAVPPVVGKEVEDQLETILLASGQPMHIRDLRQALITRGVPLPGRGDEANIILRLGRSKDRFVRTGRGMYGLSTWGLAPVPLAQRKRRVHRTRKAIQ